MTTKAKNIHYIDWPVPNVLAFTTTRQYPLLLDNITEEASAAKISVSLVKTSTFASFNLGMHVGDCFEQVFENRKFLSKLLPSELKIQWLEQVHGNHVAVIEEYSEKPIVADAAITSNKNIALAVMTADCLPILLTDAYGKQIAAIHGGWRCLAENLIEHTVEKMTASPKDIFAWLGPCISEKAFEVGAEVMQSFCLKSSQFESAFAKTTNISSDKLLESEKYQANLVQIAKVQLHALGITKIAYLNECTFFNPHKFYSFRRDKNTGRMASIICLQN